MLEQERGAVCWFGRQMAVDGLVVGTSGNVSLRAGDLLAVTPTGVDYATMTAEDVSVVTLRGEHREGLLPTSELPLHLLAYRSAAVGALVHTHSVHATAVSTLVTEVPRIHYILGLFGGPVRVAPYATYGTQELAEGVLAALADRSGCLIANHGTVTTGASLPAAYERALQLEWVCRLWLAARSAGAPRLLPPEEVALVAGKLRTYGQPTSRRTSTIPRP